MPECWLLVVVGLTSQCFKCIKVTTPECWLLIGMVIDMALQLGALHNPPTLLPMFSNLLELKISGMSNMLACLTFMYG